MAFCVQCGSPVEGAFCSKCGASVDAPGASGAPVPPAVLKDSPVVIPPAPAKPPGKGRFIFWALGGCLLLIIIAAIIVFSTGFFVAHRAGLDSGTPGAAIAKLLLSNNPEIEVLSVDEDSGVIRVRDRKTGKILTMDLKDAQKGKIVFTDGNNQKMEIKTQGEGNNATVEIQSADGSLRMGTGDKGQLPPWLPPYPNAESSGAMGFNANQGKSGSFSFKSKDSVATVAAFYEEALKSAGFRIEKFSSEIPSQGLIMSISASDDKTRRTANMTAARTEEGTTINLAFETR